MSCVSPDEKARLLTGDRVGSVREGVLLHGGLWGPCLIWRGALWEKRVTCSCCFRSFQTL